jgi:hypothetical protein
MIFLEGHDKARQVVAGNRVDRIAVAEEIKKPSEHGLVLPVSIGFFERSNPSFVVVPAFCGAYVPTASGRLFCRRGLTREGKGSTDRGSDLACAAREQAEREMLPCTRCVPPFGLSIDSGVSVRFRRINNL